MVLLSTIVRNKAFAFSKKLQVLYKACLRLLTKRMMEDILPSHMVPSFHRCLAILVLELGIQLAPSLAS